MVENNGFQNEVTLQEIHKRMAFLKEKERLYTSVYRLAIGNIPDRRLPVWKKIDWLFQNIDTLKQKAYDLAGHGLYNEFKFSSVEISEDIDTHCLMYSYLIKPIIDNSDAYCTRMRSDGLIVKHRWTNGEEVQTCIGNPIEDILKIKEYILNNYVIQGMSFKSFILPQGIRAVFNYAQIKDNYDITINVTKPNIIRSAERLIKDNTMDSKMWGYLKCLKDSNKGIVISGIIGSGKTTVLNSILNDSTKEIFIIETTKELVLDNVKHRRINYEEFEEVFTVKDASEFFYSKRQFSDFKLVIDELRSEDMANTMLLSRIPFISLVLANGAKEALKKIEVLCGLKKNSPSPFTISDRVNVIIQMWRHDSGLRIASISEVVGYGDLGAKINNDWVRKNNLSDKFIIKNPKPNEYYVQDIFKYVPKTDSFIETGWKPIS